MNPFDLPGPQFLAFYGLFGAVTLLTLHYARLRAEAGDLPRIDFSDPYLIAYLRGGVSETLRVAVLSLIDRGLLTVTGEERQTKSQAAVDLARRSVEKALLRKFQNRAAATAIFSDPRLDTACSTYKKQLTSWQLLPD